MLLGGAILPPAETLIVEDELLLPEGPLPPPVEGGLAASEEVLPPPLLVGAELFGAGALNFGGLISKIAGIPKRKDFAALPAEALIVEDELLLLLLLAEEAPLLLSGEGANPRFPDEVLEGESKAR